MENNGSAPRLKVAPPVGEKRCHETNAATINCSTKTSNTNVGSERSLVLFSKIVFQDFTKSIKTATQPRKEISH